ncbi:MAG: tyrosine/phenylalanine carboxypeptidase domain-containing protein, partial [Nitrospinota bacterium]
CKRNEKYSPCFRYRKVRIHTSDIKNTLSSIKLPRGGVGSLLRDIRTSLKRHVDLIDAVGTTRMNSVSKIMFGEPESHHFELAGKFIKQGKPEKKRKGKKGAEELKACLETYLKKSGLPDWTILIDKAMAARVSVNGARKQLRIRKDAQFYIKDFRKLEAHEIDVHAVRSFNGSCQPLRVFSTGLPGYGRTEEGLSMITEKVYGLAGKDSEYHTALYLVLLKAAEEGTFYDVFSRAKELLEGDVERAFNFTLRVRRGLKRQDKPGGFWKDHIYFCGLWDLVKFLETGGNVEDLYVGKIGIQHLGAIQLLKEQGVITPPRILPKRILNLKENYFKKEKTWQI